MRTLNEYSGLVLGLDWEWTDIRRLRSFGKTPFDLFCDYAISAADLLIEDVHPSVTDEVVEMLLCAWRLSATECLQLVCVEDEECVFDLMKKILTQKREKSFRLSILVGIDKLSPAAMGQMALFMELFEWEIPPTIGLSHATRRDIRQRGDRARALCRRFPNTCTFSYAMSPLWNRLLKA